MSKRNLNRLLGCALCLLTSGVVRGQEAPPAAPGPDMQAIQQMFVERIREMLKQTLEVTDEEWNVLEPRFVKVALLTFETRRPGMAAQLGGRGGPNFSLSALGFSLDSASQQLVDDVNKAARTLQETLNNPAASGEKIMSDLQALRDVRKKAAQELVKAKAALVELLTPRQEARLVAMGIID